MKRSFFLFHPSSLIPHPFLKIWYPSCYRRGLARHPHEKFDMNPEAIYRRYQEFQAYVGWTEDDAVRVRSIAALLDSYLPALVDDFYAEIDKHPEARKVITGGQEQVH